MKRRITALALGFGVLYSPALLARAERAAPTAEALLAEKKIEAQLRQKFAELLKTTLAARQAKAGRTVALHAR